MKTENLLFYVFYVILFLEAFKKEEINRMNVLSLFDGISVGHLALDDAGIDVEKYYASEINKRSISITQANYPKTIQLGSVENWKEWNIDWEKIDLLIGGSPCQNLSFAGNQEGLSGSKSGLFFMYRDILNHLKKVNPKILFLLENVNCKKESLDVITKNMGVQPVRINSNLVSAQNRDRFYWTNIRGGDIPQPVNKGIILSDILRKEDDGHYPLSKKHYKAFLKSYPNWKDSPRSGKAKPLLASYYKQPPHCPYISDSLSESGFRRLSPIESERCQTLPDNYTYVDGISNSARWEAIGNGWTMKVISHIFSFI